MGQGQADIRALGRILHGVIQQDTRQTLQSIPVAGDLQPLVDGVQQPPSGFKHHRLEPQGGVRHHVRQIHLGEGRLPPDTLRPEQGQHLLHQLLHPPGLRPDVLHIRLLLCRGGLRQQIGGGQDHRQGRFQLMAGVGQEALLLLPRPLHRPGSHTGEQVAAPQQHHQRRQCDQQQIPRHGPQRRLLQCTVGEGDADGESAVIAQIAQMIVRQQAALLLLGQAFLYQRQQVLLTDLIVAAAHDPHRTAGIDLRHEAGLAVLAVVALAPQGLLQLPGAALLQTAAGREHHPGEYRRQHQRHKQHTDAHDLPPKPADHTAHAPTSRQ